MHVAQTASVNLACLRTCRMSVFNICQILLHAWIEMPQSFSPQCIHEHYSVLQAMYVIFLAASASQPIQAARVSDLAFFTGSLLCLQA